MSTSIRLADVADLPDVEAIVAESYGKYVPRIGRKPGPMLDDYAALIAHRAVHVLDDGERIEGLLVLEPEPDCMLLDNVAVRPSAQGRGYGMRLIAFAEHEARQAGLPAIRLYTHEKMTENQDLYRRLGYVETHRAEEQGLRRVFMRKTLTPETAT